MNARERFEQLDELDVHKYYNEISIGIITDIRTSNLSRPLYRAINTLGTARLDNAMALTQDGKVLIGRHLRDNSVEAYKHRRR